MKARAVLLLELLLSLAVLVAAGLAIGAAIGRTTDSFTRASERTRAADAAWSAIALIEAGIESPETLNGPAREDSSWALRIETRRTEHQGLVLVTVGASASPSDQAAYTARQLVRLRAAPPEMGTGGAAPPLDSVFTEGGGP